VKLDLQRGLYEVATDTGEILRNLTKGQAMSLGHALDDGRLKPDQLRTVNPQAFVPLGPPGTNGTGGALFTPPGTPPQRG
jgi:hypothetical protein